MKTGTEQMHRLTLGKVLLAATLSIAAAGSMADATAMSATRGADNGAAHCVNLRAIRDVRILDTAHMVFEMNGRERLLNTLPHPCPGLRRGSPFMYRVSGSQLCNLDLITVLEPVGSGFQPAASCGLGDFEAITADDEKVLDEHARGR